MVTEDGQSHCHFSGLARCSSVWECPHCAAKVQAHRAAEVTEAVETWGRERVVLVTMTVRHGLGDDLDRVLTGASLAWKYMQQGRAWQKFKAEHDLGSIRALEVTHGKNGWHPHFHALWFATDASQLVEMREWLSERWASCVARAMGSKHVPDMQHGLVITPVHDASYIAKLGLEMTTAMRKRGRNGSRTAWEIADDIRLHDDPADVALWKTYAAAMKGARMLTWSRGLRERLEMQRLLEDDEVVAQEPESTTVGVIPGPTWKALGQIRGARLRVLEITEAAGFEAAVRYMVATMMAEAEVRAARARAAPS